MSLALFKSKIVLFVTTSSLNSINANNISLKFICSGLPLLSASIFELNVVWRSVCLYNWFKIIFESTSFLSSMTTLTPFLSDSSLKSEIPSIILFFAVSAILSINLDLLTWYGISWIIIASLSFLKFSKEVFDRNTHAPFPVSKASRSPFFPMINPPVGKSGPNI